MEMIPVVSSLLKTVGYDEEKEELHVGFHKGGTYVYRGVPRRMFNAMMDDASAGGYFIQNIKRRFECIKEWER